MPKDRVIVMGAAGRDFHNFNVYFRDHDAYGVVAFTAAQIPDIAGRVYPPELAGRGYPQGIPIYGETELTRLIKELKARQVVFAYSDVSHEYVMHKASEIIAAGADLRLLGPQATMLESRLPVVSVCAVRTGAKKEPNQPPHIRHSARCGQESGDSPPSHALRNAGRADLPAFLILRGPGSLRHDHRRARGIRAPHRQGWRSVCYAVGSILDTFTK